MNIIISPIKRSESGPAVANLQDALLFILQKSPTFLPEIDRPFFIANLQKERSIQTYGDVTAKTIHLFQLATEKQFHLRPTGQVDEATAAALNELLKKAGVPLEPIDTKPIDTKPIDTKPIDTRPGDPTPAPPPATTFRVQGRVQSTDGRPPIEKVTVKALDKDLRTETELGKDSADDRGFYSISYTSDQFKRAEKQSADLIVRAFNEKGEELAKSPIVFNAKPEETVDLLVGGTVLIGPSEYTRLTTDVEPTLDGVAPADLTEQDIEFLTGETAWSREYLSFYATAAKLSHQTKVSTEAFYGLFRQQMPTGLPQLLAQSPETLRRALQNAIRDNIIPANVGKELDSIMVGLKEQVIEQAFVKPDKDKPSLGELIGITIKDKKTQRDIVSKYVNHTGTPEEFWAELRKDETLGVKVDDLQFTLQLNTLAANHLPLVQALKKNTKVKSLQDLVAWEPEQWRKHIDKVGVPSETLGATDEEKAANFAQTLARTVRGCFPTAAVVHDISRSDLPAKAALMAFFDKNSDFDLQKSNIDTFLKERADGLKGVKDKAQLTQELKSLQRVHRLTPEFSQMNDLLKDKLHSAQGISRMGESAFVNRFGSKWGPDQAKQVFNNAAQTAATALVHFANYSPTFNRLEIAALQCRHVPTEGMPDWESLFGSLDLCECEHCRTVLSPAAYLVDILAFLKDRQLLKVPDPTIYLAAEDDINPPVPIPISGSAFDVLMKRRADLAEIELTCENTNTPLPYVDLVNEILEDAVSPPTPLTPAIPKQTSGTAAERAANPQYLNTAAYTKLSTAVYPWTLPFHFAAEEGNTYLNHLGVPRHELMRAFQSTNGPSNIEIASEYLGMSTVERKIISNTGASSTTPWQYWGYTAQSPWVTELPIVRKFLDVSGLTYAELTDLLTLEFLNPTPLDPLKGLVILSTDSEDPGTCDTNKLKITNIGDNLDPNDFAVFLENTHRFVRLWRILGWTMKELDLAISTLLTESSLNDNFILNLSHVQQLKEELKLSVEKVLTFWALINTRGTDSQPSLYQKLFQNPMVLEPVDRAFALDAAGTQVSKANDPIFDQNAAIDHQPTIMAALGLNDSDLTRLLDTMPSGFGIGKTAKLTLSNLSQLCRVTLLAKGLKLTIPNLLTLAELTGINPFVAAVATPSFTPAKTADTLRFVEGAQKIRTSGFTLAELDYLLRHNATSVSPIPPSEKSIATLLEDIRKGLQKIDAETALVPDLTGEFTKKCLGMLNWDAATIDTVVAALNNTEPYVVSYIPKVTTTVVIPTSLVSKVTIDSTTKELRILGGLTPKERFAMESLSNAPDYNVAVAFLLQQAIPSTLANKLAYDPSAKQLKLSGGLPKVEIITLLSLFTDPAYQSAIHLLDQAQRNPAAPRQIAVAQTQTFSRPAFSVPLAVLPTIVFPEAVKARLFYDASAQKLSFIGFMTVAERDALKKLPSADKDFKDAIDALHTAGESHVPASTEDKFLARSDVQEFFDDPQLVADRFEFVLTKLLTHLVPKLKETLIKQKLSDALKLESDITEQLLTRRIKAQTDATMWSIEDFRASTFAESPVQVAITKAAFPKQFDSFTRLHKVSMLTSKLRVAVNELEWLFSYGPMLGGQMAAWLDLNDLPVQASTSSATARFGGWSRLVDLFDLRDSLPLGSELLSDIFNTARIVPTSTVTESDLTQNLQDRLRSGALWSLADLQSLHGSSGFALTRADYQNELSLTRLARCFALLKRLGASAKQCLDWAKADLTQADATSIKQLARAKYDDEQWLTLAKPLRDELREKQRDALVAYLVANPIKIGNEPAWTDKNGLYEYFLIDVEMCPCMMTTRIVQACSSVQLFVQRSLMGLEPEVLADAVYDSHWREWKWMKNYRVWEANRKVFLYPENWIEPDLRDGKSPCFKDLENDLMQNEVTKDTAEQALLNYLEKLDTVAKLEVVGMYDEEEFEPIMMKRVVNILHVFGRTRQSPHQYFYRRRENSMWTPWSKVDLDIEGDHLIPVVWNRRLHLFWPIFSEKAKKDASPGAASDAQIKYWEIQLAWSEFKNGKWMAKRISKVSMEPIFRQKLHYLFKASLTGGGLTIKLHTYNVVLAGEGKDGSGPTPLWRSFAGFTFEDCNSEPVLMNDFAPLAIPLGTTPAYTQLVEVVSDHFGGPLEQPLCLMEGSFPIGNPTNQFESGRQDVPTLNLTPGKFKLLLAHQDRQFSAIRPKFYQDDKRVFIVSHEEVTINPLDIWNGSVSRYYHFETFYHPYVCPLIRELNRNGIDGVMRRIVQIDPERALMPQPQTFNFNTVYQPQPVVAKPYPVEDIDFSHRGAYASYNWELFFHVPLLIADRLSKNQRFEEAQQWFHYIFDPTDASSYPSPQKYWQTGHFFRTSSAKNRAEQIQALMQRLASGAPDLELEAQVDQWRKFPFNPHLIARLRTTAYQKKVVMSYIDNLITWGDQLFRRDTIESLNEATQLYVMASNILGRRPEKIKARLKPAARTFKTLESDLDSFSNALVLVENVVATVPSTGTHTGPGGSSAPLTLPSTLYFCIPKNDKLLGYWDTVADRLFKLRHCMNIEGVVRQLPLFEPPIDPALLVRAAAAGLDISSALNDINAALPHYRFNVMSQKTSELCGELKALGGALLSALEKRDAEAVSLLRSSQELKVLDAARQVRQRQVDEAKEGLEGAKKSKDVIGIRNKYYTNLKDLIPEEQRHLELSEKAAMFQTIAAVYHIYGNIISLIPDTKISPTCPGASFGGSQLGSAISAFAGNLNEIASVHQSNAGLSATRGGHKRRAEEWKLQKDTSAKELEQQDRQILAAEIRLEIAELELKNHDLQVENAKEMDRYMRDKFTNRELYDWMVSQISGIYFQCYQLSYDLAKRAERAYRFELGLADSNFIQFGYWDSMKKGLLSGERLSFDLKRMEAAYLDKNKREFELTKNISLVLLDPMALLKLRETGDCFIDLPEDLFDRDFPGHYLRRIKSVSLTIPCVTGPYTGVHATLTLVKNSVRKSSITTAPYERDPNDDLRFTDSVGAIQSIATSTGQNDSGLFELNFRDERYLPFEGAGAISQWRLQLPKDSNAFDFDTISDVILHLKYTARDGGDALRSLARTPVAPSGEFVRLFSMKHEFPTEWHRLLNPHGAQTQSVAIELSKDRFPYQFQGRTIQMNRVDLFLKPHLPSNVTLPLSLTLDPLTIPPPPTTTFALTKHNTMPELLHATMPFQSASTGPWQLASSTTLPPEAVEDLWILVHFQAS